MPGPFRSVGNQAPALSQDYGKAMMLQLENVPVSCGDMKCFLPLPCSDERWVGGTACSVHVPCPAPRCLCFRVAPETGPFAGWVDIAGRMESPLVPFFSALSIFLLAPRFPTHT